MRARHLSLVALALLAACASPVAKPPLPTRLPTAPPSANPSPPAARGRAAGARPTRPVSPVTPPAVSGDMVFDAWAAEFYVKAVKAGIPREVLDREMAGLTPDPRVTQRDSRQPEFSQPISTYIKGAVTEGAASKGGHERADVPQLADIEQRFGVPREILIAIWARESAFGAIQGDFDVVRSMASLAAQGRRRDWAEGELVAALRIIATGQASRSQLKGSWAGAMGQTQFIPSAYLSTAVDGDGDGKRDIWNSAADSLASAANLLAKGGWMRGQSWAREVTAPPDFDFSHDRRAEAAARRLDGAGRAPRRRPAVVGRGQDRRGPVDRAGRRIGTSLPAVPEPLRDPQVQQLRGLCARRRPARRPDRRRGPAGAALARRDAAVAHRPDNRPAGARGARLQRRPAGRDRRRRHPHGAQGLAEGARPDGRRLSVADHGAASEG